jgi:starch synthase
MDKQTLSDQLKNPERPLLHLSAECSPVAKVGGLGDVVGALPKYLTKAGIRTWVAMPWYNKPFVHKNQFDVVYNGTFLQGARELHVQVMKEKTNALGFELFLIHIPGLLDRDEVYGYADESDQFIAFQHGVLQWLCDTETIPSVIHCHDHHTGLTPFMMYHCAKFAALKNVPTVGTVHNGQYQGWMDWNKVTLLPPYESWKWGLLDWDRTINPLAALIKCCTAYSTVSEGYLGELTQQANGLERLFDMEKAKSYGIVNGIDTEVWDTKTDPMLAKNYNITSVKAGKQANKDSLCETFGLDASRPLLAYIGRFAGEKGADLLPEIVSNVLNHLEVPFSIIILGSGDPAVQQSLEYLAQQHQGRLGVYIGYQESLAHLIYASADFLIMPSRVEPCGLNQLYSMRYGTIPVVRSIGGLRDTVRDIGEEDGYGFQFLHAHAGDATLAVHRAGALYADNKRLQQLRKQIMKLDFSWDKSAKRYIQIYDHITT